MIRPILRYHGGKWLLAKWIIENLPAHRTYVEPFGGAASVLLRKPRSYAEVYNDLDGEVVNLFRVVREHGDDLRQALELTPFARDEFVLSYQPSSDPLEQARRTVVRSFMGFGSNSHTQVTGFRSNGNRNGTTPAHDWRNYPLSLGALIDRLQGVVIEHRDAIDVIAQHDRENTLFYVDPPYVRATRNTGRDYKHEMNDGDHIRLATCLHDIKGMVVISGYESSLYARLYRDWRSIDKSTYADGARRRVERLWISPTCRDMGLFSTA